MPNVFLVGFMGAGKSSVGSLVAAELDWAFVDLDAVVEERLGLSVPEVFARHGEPAFRRAERAALRDVAAGDRQVVATGGGTFCSEDARRLMETSGSVTVFLDAPWEVIRQRLPSHDPSRPKLGTAEQARRLYLDRRRWYLRALIVVPIRAEQSVDEVASDLVERLGGVLCAT